MAATGTDPEPLSLWLSSRDKVLSALGQEGPSYW
jgi:hypothetical protein